MRDLILTDSKILNIVTFDGDDDPTQAVNWPRRRKWSIVAVLSLMTLTTALASSMITPGVGQIMTDFQSESEILRSFVVSVYILGYASGPLIIAPLSELYGRLPLYHATNILYVIFTVACAVSPNLESLIVFRMLSGMAGSAVLNIGGGTIADLFVQEERGTAMSVWTVGPLLGPVIGPVAGGFLSEAKGWRAVFWVLSGLIFAITISFFFLMRETYPPIILERKAARLRRETGNPFLKSKMDSGLNSTQMFKRAIIRPMKLLILSPIVLSFSIFIAVVYGYLYLLFTTMPQVFGNQYGFSEGLTGLTYLGIGGGMLVGVSIFGFASDRILRSKSRNGEMKPEYRLPLMTPGAFLIPASLFVYGWTAEKQVFWLVPILGTSLLGLGLNTTFMSIQTYLVDAFTLHAASALAANTVLRSAVGALLPLAGPPMYASLGLGWGNSVLGFLAVAMIPMPFLFIKYGESIRKNPRFDLSL